MTTRAADLVDVVLGGGQDVKLPSLTREELIALGDAPMLASAEDELWWAAQGDEVRQAVAECAHRGLVARSLVRPDADIGGLAAVDSVRVVLETRKHPSWLCVLREPVAQDDTQVVIHGIERDDGEVAAMISARIEGIHLARLTTATTALDEAVWWLTDDDFHTATPEGMDPAGRPLLRTIEILLPRRPGVRNEMGDRRAMLARAGGTWRLAELEADGATRSEQQVGPPEILAWLTEAIFGLTPSSAPTPVQTP